jgi:hypothetical protein
LPHFNQQLYLSGLRFNLQPGRLFHYSVLKKIRDRGISLFPWKAAPSSNKQKLPKFKIYHVLLGRENFFSEHEFIGQFEDMGIPCRQIIAEDFNLF